MGDQIKTKFFHSFLKKFFHSFSKKGRTRNISKTLMNFERKKSAACCSSPSLKSVGGNRPSPPYETSMICNCSLFQINKNYFCFFRNYHFCSLECLLTLYSKFLL